MFSQQSTSALARGLLILMLLQVEAQWMNDDIPHRSFSNRDNAWQNRGLDTNANIRISTLRSPYDSEDITDIVATTIPREDDLDSVSHEFLVESNSQGVINNKDETQSQMEDTTTSINIRNITREKKPFNRTSKVWSNASTSGQARNKFGAALPQVPTGPFNNPLAPAPQPLETSTRAWSRPSFGQAPGSLPPSVPPEVLAPAPPFGPPSPPPPSTILPVTGVQEIGGVKPPAIPITTPDPPTSEFTVVEEILCRNDADTESFTAVMSLPSGFEAVPVFEDAPAVDATTNPSCRMIPTQLTGMFQLFVSNLKQCGVKECGEMMLCLVLRFPLMTGIKLPEDTIIEIRCRPQEKTAEDKSIIKVATSKYADRNPITGNEPNIPSVFEGGGHQFECKLEIYSKIKGTELFQKKIEDNEEVDLGEEIQLRSEVRPGDGWEYSRMTEVLIQRVGGSTARSSFNTAVLVFSDGCRNPEFQVVAKNHPQRDRNALIVNFNFRVFMFQDMILGDSLMISAKVIGCVDEADCQPVTCADDKNLGFGKRKKRSTKENIITKKIAASELLSLFPPSGKRPERSTAESDSKHHGSTTDWDRNFGIRVRFPEGNSSPLVQESLEAMECRSYLFITMAVASFFCFIAFIFAMVLFYRSRPKVIPVQMPPQIRENKTKSISTLTTASNNVMLKEDYIQEAIIPSPDTKAIDSVERNELQPSYINSTEISSLVRQRTTETQHMQNVDENTNHTQIEEKEYSCHPNKNTITVTRRPSAVIKINANETNERVKNSSIKRQPSTVIRINDNETHTTIFNQKPTPKPRSSKESNG